MITISFTTMVTKAVGAVHGGAVEPQCPTCSKLYNAKRSSFDMGIMYM